MFAKNSIISLQDFEKCYGPTTCQNFFSCSITVVSWNKTGSCCRFTGMLSLQLT